MRKIQDASEAGFTANPLSQPAPRTHQTRVANPHSWSGPCGLGRVAQRRRIWPQACHA